MRRIGQHKKNLAVPHKRGAPLSKAEKETILHTYESFKSTYKHSVKIMKFYSYHWLIHNPICAKMTTAKIMELGMNENAGIHNLELK